MTLKTEKNSETKMSYFLHKICILELNAVPSQIQRGNLEARAKDGWVLQVLQASLHLLSADAALLPSPIPWVQCLCIQEV